MTAWQITTGDCRDVLRALPAQSVHTVVTSPPYFGLRDYGTDRQIGLEPTPDEFVAALVGVFREVRRVLRDDGTVWLNLGDSYATTPTGNRGTSSGLAGAGSPKYEATLDEYARTKSNRPPIPDGCKPKDLLGIPWMVAFALRADGWFLRSDIIWSKPNPMPESVTDRPTKAHEYVFLLSKGPRYHYDADAIREADGGHDHPRSVLDGQPSLEPSNGLMAPHNGLRTGDGRNGAGRNKRSVWTVATQPYAGAHFATFPPKLIEPCILAGAPERACRECGAPWARIVERGRVQSTGGSANGARATNMETVSPLGQDPSSGAFNTGAFVQREHLTVGFAPTCGHYDELYRADYPPGVVLDPFAGSGTTGMVALRHGRSFIGIELSPTYAAMARQRIIDDAPLLNIATAR